MSASPHNPGPTARLFATSGTVRLLRAEIEHATGSSFGTPRLDSRPVVWRAAPGRLASAWRLVSKHPLLVAPGPLISPYDSPAKGFASLRLSIGGRPVGSSALPQDLADRIGDLRIEGLERESGAAPSPAPSEILAERFGAGVHYFDPWTRAPIGVVEALERVAWLRARFDENRRRSVLVGISRWKRPAIDVFADGPAGPPIHTMTAEDALAAAESENGQVLAWATRMPAALPARCAEASVPFARIEDGFLRSVGLGASLKIGASIVVDDTGIYYDPRTESRLTRILRETAFDAALVARARALRDSIVARRLSKYNVGLTEIGADWPTDRRIVLVPGQVEDDASVQTGSPEVRSNLALLRAARARNPDAFLLYKPHPDVEAGFRLGAVPEDEAARLADRQVGGLSIVDLLDRVHHVETMTSLTGFEALIRGLTVATHGRPFYSGWGLSEDLAPNADRGRTLALDELVAGALILYPRYLDPIAMKPCTPEQLLERLSAARTAEAPSRLSLGALQHLIMRARYAVFNPLVRRLRSRRGVGGDGAAR